MGSLSQVAVGAVHSGSISYQPSPLLNNHLAVAKNGQTRQEISSNQFGGGVFPQNNDNLNSKTSNYYTVINQTLAS